MNRPYRERFIRRPYTMNRPRKIFMKHPSRKKMRLAGYDYSNAGYYFVTICIYGRECILGEITDDAMLLNDAGNIVEDVWRELPQRFLNIALDEFIIMPNHFHGIIQIVGPSHVGAAHEPPLRRMIHESSNLPLIVGYLKMNTAKRINVLRRTPCRPVWQRSFYDHVIRNEEDLFRVQEYILNNPLQWAIDDENYNTNHPHDLLFDTTNRDIKRNR